MLGKAQGIFREVVEHRDLSADDEFQQKIKETFGVEAACITAEELGLEWDEKTIK